MTEDTQYNSIAEQGSNCPPFVLNAAFDDTPDNLTHVAEIGGTLVRMASTRMVAFSSTTTAN